MIISNQQGSLIMMNFKETIQFIDVLRNTGANLVPCLLGHTGIGKTELVEQYAASRNMDCIVIHVAQLEPSDFIGLYQIDEDGRTANCPPNWLPYRNDSTAKKKADNKLALEKIVKGVINPNGGILFLDEINRGHEDIRQSLYQLINKREIGTYALPEGYTIVAAANPSNSYETYEFDKALTNRFAWVKFQPEIKESFEYLTKKHGSNPILDWLKTDKDLLDLGDDDFEIDDMLLSPRMTENAILLYNEITQENKTIKRKFLEALIQKEKVQAFLSYEEEMQHLNFKEVLQGKKQEKVKSLIRDKRLDVLSTITIHLAEYFDTYSFDGEGDDIIKKGKEKDAVKNLTDFMLAAPAELNTVFVDACKCYSRTDSIFHQTYFRTKLKEKLNNYKKLF